VQFVSTGFAEEIAKGASGRYYYLPNVRTLAVSTSYDHLRLVQMHRQQMQMQMLSNSSCLTLHPLLHMQASDQAIAMAASSAMAEAKAA
jgi:hypothetical protein